MNARVGASGSDDASVPAPASLAAGAMPSAGGLVLLFGGSFDPVHRGHVELSRAAAVSLAGRSGRSVVRWFIPAHRSPHKAEATMFDGPARAELLRIALAGEDDAIVWTDELDRHSTALVRGHEPAQSYSIDTATRARAALDIAGRTDVGLRWLMGADQALALHRWKDAHRLVAIAPPVILRRIAAPGVAGVAQAAPVSLDDDVRALSDELRATGAWTDAELAVLREGVIDTPWIDVSSTTIRRWLANAGAHRDELRASLPPGVLARLMSGV